MLQFELSHIPLSPSLCPRRSVCAEGEIRGKDDKSILQITRPCVYYSELRLGIQSGSTLDAFWFASFLF